MDFEAFVGPDFLLQMPQQLSAVIVLLIFTREDSTKCLLNYRDIVSLSPLLNLVL